MTGPAATRLEPEPHCSLCPRLVQLRHELHEAKPDWHNAPVASFGDPQAQLLIVGLAPGMAGANRTGRPFTGDYAGIVLYPALEKHGFSAGKFAASSDDGLVLQNCRITNAVRCLPPQNKPTGGEINTCRQFLTDELSAEPSPSIVLVLGRIAFESTLRALGEKPARQKFAHGQVYEFPGRPRIVASYHCSRYNINTNRLTVEMFDKVMDTVKALLAG